MMNIVFDTDILSIFAKADAIQYLEKLFSKDHLLITPSVYRELKVPKEFGYDFPDQIFNSKRFELVQLTGGEVEEFKSKLLKAKTVHSGELEAVIIARSRGYMFSSNDTKALEFAVSEEIEVLYLHSILRALWRFVVLTPDEVKELIRKMEIKDNMEIKEKHLIFD
jgi:predicted nucleic acid-binding protein